MKKKKKFVFKKIFRKIVPLMRSGKKKICTSGQVTYCHIIRRMRFACWLNKAKDTHSEYVMVVAYYMEIKCQLDAKDDIYCRFYCMLNMFRAILCRSSGAREYYTDGRCLWYLVLWFSVCRYGVELEVMCPVSRLLLIHGSSSCKNAHQMLRLYISFMPAFHLI